MRRHPLSTGATTEAGRLLKLLLLAAALAAAPAIGRSGQSAGSLAETASGRPSPRRRTARAG